MLTWVSFNQAVQGKVTSIPFMYPQTTNNVGLEVYFDHCFDSALHHYWIKELFIVTLALIYHKKGAREVREDDICTGIGWISGHLYHV